MRIRKQAAKFGLHLGLASALLIPVGLVSAEAITVQPGDTLYKIALRTNTTVTQIKQANGLMSDMILVGQKLNIPDKNVVHTVVQGDTLWKLSQAYKVTMDQLIKANNLTNTMLNIGQKLIIPSTASGITHTGTTLTPVNGITYKNYVVQRGDTFWSIALNHGIPMPELLNVNNLSENSSLLPSQSITIPIHTIAVTATPGPQYGENLDWFEAVQYLFPINKVATVTDFSTGMQFNVKRMMGAFHSDTEPLTAADAAIIKRVWGGNYSWKTRAVIVTVDDRRIAASMTSMPHGEDFLANNDFVGHFDIHFKNSLRHADGMVDMLHQAELAKAAGIRQ